MFSVKVCPWYKTDTNSKKPEYLRCHKSSIQGIQFRTVLVSLMAFSEHKTMKYTLEVGSNIFTNLRQDRGLNCHCIFKSRVDSIYTLLSTDKNGH